MMCSVCVVCECERGREKDDEESVTAGGRRVEVKGEGRTGRGYREIQTLCFFFLVQQKKRPDSKWMASPRGVRVEGVGGGGRGRWSSSQRRRFISTVAVFLFFFFIRDGFVAPEESQFEMASLSIRWLRGGGEVEGPGGPRWSDSTADSLRHPPQVKPASHSSVGQQSSESRLPAVFHPDPRLSFFFFC